jgi:ferredoxin--NADP+ reductase
MNEIIYKRKVRSDVYYYKLATPEIARKARPGQFVIVRLHEHGERIPISLADIDPEAGTISLMFMTVGKTTTEMSTLETGKRLADVVGPLGNPTEIDNYGKVILVGGGFGVAPLYPIAKAMRATGNEVVTVMGARTKDLLVYEEEMSSVSDKLLITTDDGSRGTKGVVTVALAQELELGADLVMAVGPAIMMKFVCKTTEPYKIKTIVSLNPIMVDGTGMCGACRVSVGGQTKFGCTDGPDFDGHLVDWDLLMSRQRMYLAEEKQAMERYQCNCAPAS